MNKIIIIMVSVIIGIYIIPTTILCENYDTNYYIYENNEKYGLMDKDGNIKTDAIYDSIYYIENYNIYMIESDDAFGILNANCETVIPCEYYIIQLTPYSTVLVENYDSQSMLMTIDGDILIEMNYQEIEYYNDYIIAYMDNSTIFYDKNGKILYELNCRYNDYGTRRFCCSENYDDISIARKNNGELTYIDIQGNEIYSNDWTPYSLFMNGYATVRLNSDNSYAIINKCGNVIQEVECDFIYPCSNKGIFKYKQNDMMGLLDINGSILIYPEYELILDGIVDTFTYVKSNDGLFYKYNYNIGVDLTIGYNYVRK